MSSVLVRSALFGSGLSLLILIWNLSFQWMGVNLSEFEDLFSTFLPILSLAYLKALGFSTLFFGLLGYTLDPRGRFSKYLLYLLLFLLTGLAWFSSIVEYPQLYGEFFYTEHPSLLPLLYFLTDHTSPGFWKWILATFLIACIFWELFQTRLQKKEVWEYSLWILALGIFHWNGFWPGLLIIFLLLLFRNFWKQRIRLDWKFLSAGSVAILLLFPLFASPAEGNGKKPSILILSADSLRPDYLGIGVSPNLDRLAKESFAFTDHHTTIPRTFPAWADLLTGRYSMEHGIRHMFPDEKDKASLRDHEIPTLPGILNENGYKTGVISSFAGDIFPRAPFGFQTVHAPTFNAKVLSQQRILESQIHLLPILTGAFIGGGEYFPQVRGLSTLGDDRLNLESVSDFIEDGTKQPFFLVYFSSVIHFPYSPPYPFYKKYSDPSYYGRFKYYKYVDPKGESGINKADIQAIRNIYKGSVNSFDSFLGDLEEKLKKQGVWDNLWIVVTADHGESLYESQHGQGHGEHLEGDEVTHIPLFIRPPKNHWNHRVPAVWQYPTSSVDLFSTILDMAGVSKQPNSSGLSLLPWMKGGALPQDRIVYSETGIWFSDSGKQIFQNERIHYPNILRLHEVESDGSIVIRKPDFKRTILFGKHRMAEDSRWKLIYVPTETEVKWKCFDRVHDPQNQKLLPSIYCGRLKDWLIREVVVHGPIRRVGDYLIPLPN